MKGGLVGAQTSHTFVCYFTFFFNKNIDTFNCVVCWGAAAGVGRRLQQGRPITFVNGTETCGQQGLPLAARGAHGLQLGLVRGIRGGAPGARGARQRTPLERCSRGKRPASPPFCSARRTRTGPGPGATRESPNRLPSFLKRAAYRGHGHYPEVEKRRARGDRSEGGTRRSANVAYFCLLFYFLF